MENGLRDEVSHITHAGKMHYKCFWVNPSEYENIYTSTCDFNVKHEHFLFTKKYL